MARSIPLLLSAVLGITVSAQAFHRSYTLENGSNFSPMNECRLSDGGYLLCGNDWNDFNFQLVRIGEGGSVLWGKQLPPIMGQEIMDALAVGELANGDIYLLVAVFGPNLTPDRVLVRMSAGGDVLWVQKMVFGPSVHADYTTRASRVAETTSGDIVVNVSAMNRAVLTKLTGAGALLWSKSYTTDIDTAYDKHPSFDMELTDDGGALVCGKDRDWPYLLRTDASGELLWGRTYYAVDVYSHLRDMEVLSNGDLLFAGMHDTAAVVLRMSGSGTIQWMKHYTGSIYFQTLHPLGDGTFLVGSAGFGNVLRVDADGSVLDAFSSGTTEYAPGLMCVSGEGGMAHMAGTVVDIGTMTSFNYLGRFNPATPPECLYTPLAVSVIDVPSVVGSSGVSTLEETDEPVNVTALNWNFFPSAWTSAPFCSFVESVAVHAAEELLIAPTLISAGEPIMLRIGTSGTVQMDLFGASGALVQHRSVVGPLTELSTSSLAPGLYTIRLSSSGTQRGTARVVVQ